MVADTLQHGIYIDQYPATKITRGPAGELIGLAGSLAKSEYFKAWYLAARDPATWPELLRDKEDKIEALVLAADGSGSITYYCDYPYGVQVGTVAAIGTGQEFAMGAMLAGKSAPEAVKIACQLDIRSAMPSVISVPGTSKPC